MIERFLPLQFIKKSPLYGSYQGMRYRLRYQKREKEEEKEEESLEVCVYPEPYAFDATPEEQKTYTEFAFSEEGYEEALAYLNREYETGSWGK